jgi:hypothetical protein
MWGTLYDKGTGLWLTFVAGPHQRSLSWVQVLWDSNLTPPKLECQVPIFMSSRNKVAQLYLQMLGFALSVLSNPVLVI